MKLKDQQNSSDELIPKTQQAMYMTADKDQKIMTHQDVQSVQADIDQETDEATFAYKTPKNNIQQYGHFMSQQQNFISHSQLHPIENTKLPGKEASIIDLNKSSEDQPNQLQTEKEKQLMLQLEILNCNYQELGISNKNRGNKLRQISTEFIVYKEDMNEEMRNMAHRLRLAEKEKESAEASVEQMRELCEQYKTETESNKKSVIELNDKYEKLIQTNLIQIDEQKQEIDVLKRSHHEHFMKQNEHLKFEKDTIEDTANVSLLTI